MAVFRRDGPEKEDTRAYVREIVYIYYRVLYIRSRCNLFTLGGPDVQQYGYAHGVCPDRPPVSLSSALAGDVQFSWRIDSSCIAYIVCVRV